METNWRRLLGLRERRAGASASADENARDSENYRDALVAGWVVLPPEAGSGAPDPDEDRAALLERYYRNQSC